MVQFGIFLPRKDLETFAMQIADIFLRNWHRYLLVVEIAVICFPSIAAWRNISNLSVGKSNFDFSVFFLIVVKKLYSSDFNLFCHNCKF